MFFVLSKVLGFFAALCDLHALPILYYHYPAQTKLKLSAADVAEILRLPDAIQYLRGQLVDQNGEVLALTNAVSVTDRAGADC